MKPRENHPSLLASTFVVVALIALWGWVRLFVFRDSVFPLTFVLPLLVGVWTRRYWQVWAMAVIFASMTPLKLWWLLPDGAPGSDERTLLLLTTYFNIVFGAAVVSGIIALRARLDRNSEQLAAQNAELEAQAEELAQQNEEIKVQAEELAQQNEEIESQSEELVGQNEELQQSNELLSHREEILQGLLESTRTPESGRRALADVCARSLPVIGLPAASIAVLRRDGDTLKLKTQATTGDGPAVPDDWPVAGSIASVVLERDRTAYVSDLQQEPALAAPFQEADAVRSVLATPLHVRGEHYGVVVACSRQPAHWTPEQFQIIEWIAAQCGLIAEGLRWQNELAERAREIEEANQAKDQFLAMLSHELRTPLTPALAAAGELEHDDRIPEDVREDLRMIRRNIAIQSRLVDDLLDVTKLARGKLVLEPQQLDLAALLHETALIVAPDLDARDQRLELDLFAAEGRCVEGDGPRLQQVFWNLLKNAIKFSPAKARIALRTEFTDGAAPLIRVEVADAGVGIDPANLDRIFRPFEQVACGGKQRSGDSGLGLGLSIAKAIVDLHGGSIEVASEGIGRGARFTVQLPLLANGGAPRRSSAARGQQPDGASESRRLRILLVEDHGDTGRILARLLRNAGHQVDHAETAAGAREAFGRAPFDLLISDIGLPDESGLELMKKLRTQQPELRGICLSGYGMEDDLKSCLQVGFTEHLTKPVDMQRLHAAIARTAAAVGIISAEPESLQPQTQ